MADRTFDVQDTGDLTYYDRDVSYYDATLGKNVSLYRFRGLFLITDINDPARKGADVQKWAFPILTTPMYCRGRPQNMVKCSGGLMSCYVRPDQKE